MYALRQSSNIQADLVRGWSAWMSSWHKNLAEVLDQAAEIDSYDAAEAWERWQERGDGDDREEFAAWYLERHGFDYRQDPTTGSYGAFHHAGLSCYALEATSEEAALAEAKALADRLGGASGFGQETEGAVRVVAALGDDWYLLEADDCANEI